MNKLRLHFIPLVRFISATNKSVVHLHTTSNLLKVNKKAGKSPASDAINYYASTQNLYIKEAFKTMQYREEAFKEELARHVSLQVDLRKYGDIMVKLENGEEHLMSHLGRVAMKDSKLVMINFSDKPATIKSAKVALQKKNINPQQEGVVLFIQIPPMTRERREQIANDARKRILNRYKDDLNDVYSHYCKKVEDKCKAQDEQKKTLSDLLTLKSNMVAAGNDLVEGKIRALLKENV